MYLCTWYHLALNSTMAKVGYIFKAAGYDGFDTDVEWMKQYGCVQVIEEENGHEKLRPQWKQLMASMERGDEIVLAKFSNALRGSRELAPFTTRLTVVATCSLKPRLRMCWRYSVRFRRSVPHCERLQRISSN